MTIRIDAIESATGAAFGYVVAVAANHTVLPLFGFTPTVGQSLGIGAVFFVISTVQRLAFRRLFRWLA